MTPTRIDYVWLETAPYVRGLDRDVIDPDYADLPAPFLAALDHLLTHVDDANCWNCGMAVGFVLADDDNRGTIEWFITTLARENDGPVALLCQQCEPYVPDAEDWRAEGGAS